MLAPCNDERRKTKDERYLASRTNFGQPLTWSECSETAPQFGLAQFYPYALLYRLRRRIPVLGGSAAQRVDAFMLSILPPLRGLAGILVIGIEKPRLGT